MSEDFGEWTVELSAKAKKQQEKLPFRIKQSLKALIADLRLCGPKAVGWTNYGSLSRKGEYYHCHLNKQHPRYVAVWRVETNKIKFIGVRYVGTHEGVNYKKID